MEFFLIIKKGKLLNFPHKKIILQKVPQILSRGPPIAHSFIS
jgi:hypothetical protein